MLYIGIIDNHTLFRKSLLMLINSYKDMTVVIDVGYGKEFLDVFKTNPVDLVILDASMHEIDGYQTCKYLHDFHPEVKILVVSELPTKESVCEFIDLGAHGYLTKNAQPEQLEFAIRGLHQNGFYFGFELGALLHEVVMMDKHIDIPVASDTPEILITPRELEIIKMASREYSSIEIAKALNITLRTVETHRKRIMEKTHSKNFIGVILFSLKYKLLKINDF